MIFFVSRSIRHMCYALRTYVCLLQELVSCFGGGFLAGVFRILAQGYRYRCSGIPDLVVWNSSTLEYKVRFLTEWRLEKFVFVSWSNKMESVSVCNHTRDLTNRTSALRSSDLLIMNMIMEDIGWHKVLLSIVIIRIIAKDVIKRFKFSLNFWLAQPTDRWLKIEVTAR